MKIQNLCNIFIGHIVTAFLVIVSSLKRKQIIDSAVSIKSKLVTPASLPFLNFQTHTLINMESIYPDTCHIYMNEILFAKAHSIECNEGKKI